MKSKLLMLALAISMLAIAIAGATTAYFTDTKKAINTFTYGDVAITLTELDASGIVQDITETDYEVDYGSIYPGQVITKKPTVTLKAGSQNSFIGAVITVSSNNGISALIQEGTTLENGAKSFLKGGLLDAGETILSIKEVGNTVVYYVLAPSAQTAGSSLTIFDTMNIPKTWDNDDAAACAGLKVTIEAFAVQSAGFPANAPKDAMIAAFHPVFTDSTWSN